jgi:hypothetical protein
LASATAPRSTGWRGIAGPAVWRRTGSLAPDRQSGAGPAVWRRTGSLAPDRVGGHRPKTIAGADRDWLVPRCREKPFTLRGLVAELAAERDLTVDDRSVWEFVHAEKLSDKKRR